MPQARRCRRPSGFVNPSGGRPPPSPDRYRPNLASSLSNLGVRLFELGRPADALPPTQEAVTTYRELATANPDRYLPDVARSLANLGVILPKLGRPADALPSAQEAVTIRRELAATAPTSAPASPTSKFSWRHLGEIWRLMSYVLKLRKFIEDLEHLRAVGNRRVTQNTRRRVGESR